MQIHNNPWKRINNGDEKPVEIVKEEIKEPIIETKVEEKKEEPKVEPVVKKPAKPLSFEEEYQLFIEELKKKQEK